MEVGECVTNINATANNGENSPNSLNLENVAEDGESCESKTANEVEVTDKALKFKISTDYNLSTTGRNSHPGSRKGSRERVQYDSLAGGGGEPELLENLKNKRNSEHCVKMLSEVREIRKMRDDIDVDKESYLEISQNSTNGGDVNCCSSRSTTSLATENKTNSTATTVETVIKQCKKDSVQGSSSEKAKPSIMMRFKQFTERLSASLDKDVKFKMTRSSNRGGTLPMRRKNECCANDVTLDESRKASTLPKTKKIGFAKKGWRFFIMGGREKAHSSSLEECWNSDKAENIVLDASVVNTDANRGEGEAQSISSTSQSQCNVSKLVKDKVILVPTSEATLPAAVIPPVGSDITTTEEI